MTGSWYGLLAITKAARDEDTAWRAQRVWACPNDGVTLQNDPQGRPRCRFCGYIDTGQDHP